MNLYGVVAGLALAFISLDLAHASPDTSKGNKGTSSTSTSEDPAVARYIEGERHYAAGRYELAVVEFNAALKLSGKPELHFNIANCHERAGNYQAAAESLGNFLNSGNAPEPEILRERIWRLKRRVAIQEMIVTRQVEQQVRAKLGTEVSLGPSHSRRPAYYTLAAGGALLATGVVFASLSRIANNDAAPGCIRQVCTQDAKDSLDKEERYAKIADITILAGVAVAGVGTYLWFRSRPRREPNALQVLPVIDTQRVGIWAHARF